MKPDNVFKTTGEIVLSAVVVFAWAAGATVLWALWGGFTCGVFYLGLSLGVHWLLVPLLIVPAVVLPWWAALVVVRTVATLRRTLRRMFIK